MSCWWRVAGSQVHPHHHIPMFRRPKDTHVLQAASMRKQDARPPLWLAKRHQAAQRCMEALEARERQQPAAGYMMLGDGRRSSRQQTKRHRKGIRRGYAQPASSSSVHAAERLAEAEGATEGPGHTSRTVKRGKLTSLMSGRPCGGWPARKGGETSSGCVCVTLKALKRDGFVGVYWHCEPRVRKADKAGTQPAKLFLPFHVCRASY